MRRRPLLRAAAVGGAGYMAGRGAARRQATETEQDARLSALEQQQAGGGEGYGVSPQQAYAPPPQQGYAAPPQQGYAPPPAAPPPAAPATESSMMDQLSQLAALHQQGVLTDEEFTAAKAKLLGT